MPVRLAAAFHALTLWRNHMHPGWLKVSGGDESLRAFATRAGDEISLMLVNTSPDQARRISVRLGDQPRGGTVRAVRFSTREYFWPPMPRLRCGRCRPRKPPSPRIVTATGKSPLIARWC